MGEGQVPAGHVKGQKQKGKMVAGHSGMKARDELMLKKIPRARKVPVSLGNEKMGVRTWSTRYGR